MNTLSLKFWDAVFWKPCCVVAQRVSHRRRVHEPDRRPLIIRPGGMGDLIVLCMALEELRLDPKSFFWLIEKRSRDWAVFLGLEHVCYDVEFPRAFRAIAGGFERVINTEQHFGLAQAAALWAKSPRGTSAAFDSNRGAGFADITVPYDPMETHEFVEFYRLIARALHVDRVAPVPPARERRAAPTGKPLAGLGGLHARSRSLDLTRWTALLRDWCGEQEFEIVSTPEDEPFAQQLAGRFAGRARAAVLPFGELCRKIQTSEKIFTVDSGFLHIASYFGVPTSVVFTSSRDSKWRPLARFSRVIRRTDLPCQPCAMFAQVPPCRHGFACKDVDFVKNGTNLPGGSVS